MNSERERLVQEAEKVLKELPPLGVGSPIDLIEKLKNELNRTCEWKGTDDD